MTLIRAETRESARMLGTFFKSIGARLFRKDIEELLEDVDARIIQVDNVATRLRLLAASFEKLDAGEKIRVATQISGVRQASRLVNILNAINRDAGKIDISIIKSIGSAERDAAKRLDDLVVKFQIAQREINKTVIKFIETDTVKTIINLFTKMIGGIGAAFGALAPILAPITALVGTLGAISFTKSFAKGMGIIGGGRRDLASKALVAATTTNTGSVTRLTASIDRLSGVASTGAATGGLGPGGVPIARGTGLGSHLRRGGRGAGFSPFFMTPLGGGGGAGGADRRLATISRNNLSAALMAFPGKTAETLSRRDRFAAASMRREFRNELMGRGMSPTEADAQARRRMRLPSVQAEMARRRRAVTGQNLLAGRSGLLGRGGFGAGLAGSIIGGAMSTSAIRELEKGSKKTGKLIAGSIIQNMGTLGLGGGMIGSMFGPAGTGIGAIIGVATGAIVGVTQALNQLSRIEEERFNEIRQSGIESFIKTGKLGPSFQREFDENKMQDFFFGAIKDLPKQFQKFAPTRSLTTLEKLGGGFSGRDPRGPRKLTGVNIEKLMEFPEDMDSDDLRKQFLAFARGRLNVLITAAEIPLDEAAQKLVDEMFKISDQFESSEQVHDFMKAIGFLTTDISEMPKHIFSLSQTINRFNLGVGSELREITTTLGLFRESLKDNIEQAKQRTLSPDFLESLLGGSFTPKFGAVIREDAAASEISNAASRLGVTNQDILSMIDEIDREERIVRDLARAAAAILNPDDLSDLVSRVTAFTDDELLKMGHLQEEVNANVKELDLTDAMKKRFDFLEREFGDQGTAILEAMLKGVSPDVFADQNLVQALEANRGLDVKRTQVVNTLNDAIKAENEIRLKELKFSRLQIRLNKQLLSLDKDLLNTIGQFAQQQAQRLAGAGLVDDADALRAGLAEVQDALLLDINNLMNGIQFITRGQLGGIVKTQNFSKIGDVARSLIGNITLFQSALADIEIMQQGGGSVDFGNISAALAALGIDINFFTGNLGAAQSAITSGLDEVLSKSGQLQEGLKNALSAGIQEAQRMGTEFRKAFDFVTQLGQTFLSDPTKFREQARLIDSLIPSILNAIDRAGVAGVSRKAFTKEDILEPGIQRSIDALIGGMPMETLQELVAALGAIVGTQDLQGTAVSGEEVIKLIQLVVGQRAAGFSNFIPSQSVGTLRDVFKAQEEVNRDIVVELQNILHLQRQITEEQQGIVNFNAKAFADAFSNIPDTINLVQEPILVTVNLTGADAVANAITKQAKLNIGAAVIDSISQAFGEEGLQFPRTALPRFLSGSSEAKG